MLKRPIGIGIAVAVLIVTAACEKVIVDPDVSTGAVNPKPADGVTGITIATTLSWEIKGDLADYDFDVYFGETDPPPLVKEGHNGTQYDVGHLQYNTTYYWQIVTRDRYGGVVEGHVWSFSTWDGYFINEGFEGSFPPEGWTADPEWTQSDDAYTGNYSAECYLEYPGSGSVSAELTTPWLDKSLTAYDRVYASWATKHDSSGGGGVGLIVYLEGGDGLTRSLLSGSKDDYWEVSSWDFSPPLESDYFRLRFRCEINSGGTGTYVHLCIDDIKLTDFMQLPPSVEIPAVSR